MGYKVETTVHDVKKAQIQKYFSLNQMQILLWKQSSVFSFEFCHRSDPWSASITLPDQSATSERSTGVRCQTPHTRPHH